MEVIRIAGYTENEKFHIAKDHLVAKQLKKNGLLKKQLVISDAAIRAKETSEKYAAKLQDSCWLLKMTTNSSFR